MRKLFLVALAAATMAALPAGIAHANNGDPSSATSRPPAPPRTAGTSGDLVFYGSGWGHGVGMSQWGSFGLAKQGWSYTDILTHYYSNTTVGQAPASAPTTVRVGLTWARSSLHLTAQAGPVTLRFGKPTAPDKFKIPKGSTWTVGPNAQGHFVITNARGVTYPAIGGPNWKMYAAYTQNSAQLRIPEAGHAYGRGYIVFDSYKLGSAWAIRAIAVLDPDQYLYGLGEVPNYWPLDALKVQAVAGRTYAFYVIANHGGRYADCNCDLYPDARSQSYLGWDKESDTLGDVWRRAVDQTSGQVVLYHGDLILANYYSTSGGYTESSENVWFGPPVPYLRSVCDPGDYAAPAGLRTWQETLTRSQVGNALGVGTISSFTGVSRSTNSGRIIWITANGSGGLRGSSRKLTGPEFSSDLGMMDDKVWIDSNRNIEGAIRGEYDSLMCAPGLAMSPRFKAGDSGKVQRFADGSIYLNPKAQSPLWLRGAVYDKYLSLGGARSVLGLPRSGTVRLSDPPGCGAVACTRGVFDGGRIYDKGQADAFEIHGPVLAYWLKTGGAYGVLGFPTSDVKKLQRPAGAVRSTFEHGTVTCPATGKCTRTTS